MFHPDEHPLRKKIEQREIDIFINQTTELFNLATAMAKHPYMCSENCKAPDDFYLGNPWIKEVPLVQEGAEQIISCKIWDGLFTSAGKNSDGMKWYLNNKLVFRTESETQNNLTSLSQVN